MLEKLLFIGYLIQNILALFVFFWNLWSYFFEIKEEEKRRRLLWMILAWLVLIEVELATSF